MLRVVLVDCSWSKFFPLSCVGFFFQVRDKDVLPWISCPEESVGAAAAVAVAAIAVPWIHLRIRLFVFFSVR